MSISSLEERNAEFTPLTVVLNVEDAAAVAKQTAAEDEDEVDVADVVIRGQPSLTASMYPIPIALLLHKNGIRLVLGDLLVSRCVKTDKDVDPEEAATRLAEVMAMIMSEMFLPLTAMTPLIRMSLPPLPLLQPIAVVVTDAASDAAPIQTIALDS